MSHNSQLQRTASRAIATSTTHVHVSTSPIQPRYQDPSIYDPKLLPPVNHVPGVTPSLIQTSTIPSHIRNPDVLVTLYNFPTFEPLEFVHYPATHLRMPLRRDILHRAVIYEGDNTRSDSVGVITRREHPGSGRKLSPQKGQGRARVGDSSSPIRSTGVKVHGPKTRSFKTDLPRKMYDMAWRMALSYRYRKGELVIVDDIAAAVEALGEKANAVHIAKLVEAFNGTSLGTVLAPFKDAATGEKPTRTMWVMQTSGARKHPFYTALKTWYPKDVVKNAHDVDVKNLLEGQRIVMERGALDWILSRHQKDLKRPIDMAKNKLEYSADAAAMARAVEELAQMKLAQQQSEAEEGLEDLLLADETPLDPK